MKQLTEKQFLKFIQTTKSRHLDLNRLHYYINNENPDMEENNNKENILFPRRIDESNYYDRIGRQIKIIN